MRLSKLEEKNHIKEAITHITVVMSNISDQTTTWNYLKEAVNDLRIVLNVVYSN